MKSKTIKRVLTAIAVSLMMNVSAFTVQTVDAERTYAAEVSNTENMFDKTNVNDDLREMDLSSYTFNVKLTPQVIYFTEYCYGENAIDCENYGIYLYVYNPAKVKISERTGANTVNIATKYDDTCEPVRYENVKLKPCGTSTGVIDGLIYKFRVIDEGGRLLENARKTERKTGKRRYDVAGLQLQKVGGNIAEDYAVSKTYYMAGYAAGYSATHEKTGTLRQTAEEGKTVSLNVQHAFYRAEGNNGKEYTQDSLASVYFAVPNEYVEEYGELYAVHANWLKAVTDWIFVTGNSKVYNELTEYIGQNISGKTLQYGFGAGRTYTTGGIAGEPTAEHSITYAHSYNKGKTVNGIFQHWTKDAITKLNYVLPVKNGMDKTDSADNYTLDYTTLIKYMESFSKDKTDLISERYSEELFSAIDEKITDATLTAEDTQTLKTRKMNSIFGWWRDGQYSSELEDVPVIQEIERVTGAAQVQKDYYIDESLYDEVKDYYNEYSANAKIYVFHFAVDDYYSAEAVNLDNNSLVAYETDSNAYLAKEAVYLNFDVIDIGLKGENEAVTVFGCVSDPIDVISSLTPPTDTTSDGLKKMLQGVLSLVGLIILTLVIVALWNPLITVISIIGKILATPFKAIKNRKNKKSKKE